MKDLNLPEIPVFLSCLLEIPPATNQMLNLVASCSNQQVLGSLHLLFYIHQFERKKELSMN